MAQANSEYPAARDRKNITFTQSIIRFGIPWVIFYHGISYILFRLGVDDSGLHYPWWFLLSIDIPVTLLVSAICWLLMRQLADRKRRRSDGAE